MLRWLCVLALVTVLGGCEDAASPRDLSGNLSGDVVVTISDGG